MKIWTGMAAAAVLLAAGPVMADPPAAEIDAVMKEYFKLWNAGDGAAITSRIYKFDQTTNPMQTQAGFDASYARLKGQGYDHSELNTVESCLLTKDLALAEMRFSRIKTDKTFLAKDIVTLYKLRKGPEGWRIAEMINMDRTANLNCTSAKF
jgi:hypothetical protein